jgi:hypothetical protein
MSLCDAALDALRHGSLVVLPAAELAVVVPSLRTVEEHDTFFAGPLRIVETAAGLALAEQDPGRGLGFLRPAASLAAAQALVRDRLAVYERMWDGCGCKVDYFDTAGTSGTCSLAAAGTSGACSLAGSDSRR